MKVGFAYFQLVLLDPVKYLLTIDVKTKQIQIRKVSFCSEH
jgi:hypothetical protein